MTTVLDMFQKVSKQRKLNKTQQKIKNKVNKFNLFQEEVNQTRENKTKLFHKTVKNSWKMWQQADLDILQDSTWYNYKTWIRTILLVFTPEIDLQLNEFLLIL